ncbi:hypothetical protein C0989_002764 [Termitomyces sp. Mn162]|nr:hypothetical protein C0989_002764 [Termitomyces sp. Mn162]
MAMELIKAFPNLHFKLQDRPDRIHQAETEVWPELLPSAIAEKRIEFKAIDFFVDSPIEGCDVYYIHENIEKILLKSDCIGQMRNVFRFFATSAQSSSPVLASLSVSDLSEKLPGMLMPLHNTDDFILQHTHRHHTQAGTPQADSAPRLKEAPEPLLPNYGAGNVHQYDMDIALMVVMNTRERTLEEFINIANKADLRFVKLWQTGEMAVLEFQAILKAL